MDSIVHIRIGKQRKATGVRKSTDCPYFNEYFVFEFDTTLSKLLDEQLVLTMIQPRKIWRSRRIIGYFNLDIATVWTAPEHQFFHKWAIIAAELNDKKPGPKGYLKIDIGIVTKGNVPHFPVTVESVDNEIEGNLLLPENATHDRSRANFIFQVFHAEELPKIKSSGCKKIMDHEQLPSTCIQISFAGLTGKTCVKKNTQNPIWNEKIVFTELFPSLCQRIKIELKYTQHASPVIHYIYLKHISNEGENGFLPIFGPSYIYLYTTEYSETNYNGKLLLEMKTEILTDLMWSSNSVEIYPIYQMPDSRLWNIQPMLLFCNVYSVTMLDKKYKDKQISLEITMGGSVSDDASVLAENTTISLKPCPDNKQIYWYLPYADQVMCMSLIRNMYDNRRKIYNMNMMKKIYDLLEVDMKKIQELFEHNYKKHREEIHSLYVQVAEKLESNCRIYLSIIRASHPTIIELDEKKIQLCIKEMKDIEANILTIIQNQSKKKIYRKLLNILCKIYSLIEEVQSWWPDVFIWMLSGNKKIGYYRIQIKEIIFSNNSEEKGLQCGTLQYIFMKPINKAHTKLTFGEDSAMLCRVRLQLWVGLNSDKEHCLKMVSNCFEPFEKSEKYEISKKLVCEEKQCATCTVYIYQGRFLPGADNSGLSDPYVQVVFNEHILKSKAVPKTIHPVWNETLTFKNITLYGSIEFISTNTPAIILEAYDQDILSQSEFIGRCSLVPETHFSNENIPKLHWVTIYNGDKVAGELLAAAELVLENVDDCESPIYTTMDVIPDNIRPAIKNFRLDVYFWGVHDLKKLYLKTISKPKITIECGGTTLHSTTLHNTKKYLNFSKPYQSVVVYIPDNEEYYPPLSINMFDCRGFGLYIFVGTYLGRFQDYTYKPLLNSVRNTKLAEGTYSESITTQSSTESESGLQEIHVKKYLRSHSVQFDLDTFKLGKLYLFNKLKKRLASKMKDPVKENDSVKLIDLEMMDWWTKFYISTENSEISKKEHFNERLKIKMYPCELESVEDFNHFNDLIHTFKLYRGKRTGDEVLDEDNIIATFKGAIRLYKWPPAEDVTEEYVTETGHLLQDGAFQHYPVNEMVSYVARVYVIRAFNLRPKDLSGKSDPYICISLGEKQIVDKDNYVPNEINPVFGRCYELKGVFPNDNMLTIALWDWDISSTDDLIGETKIDLENRLYTNHRANCGLPTMYLQHGPCAWRDQHKPSQILQILCRRNKIGEPEYFENAIKVGPRIFTDTEPVDVDQEVKKEILSLMALNHWPDIPLVGCALVPEHVETRSLYHYSKPGLEQGKLQLWVDIFPSGDCPPPPPVDIKPRSPLPYELHVIIWNTDNVILDEDDFFIGERKSDIYVKGWLTGPEESQCTDVHYNSISGEGNFNWRFIFPFFYLSAEDRIIVRKKTSVFSVDETQYKLPCYLNLQVWDNDTFSEDDFLGSLSLRLSHLPRGAKTAKLCTLNILKSGAPTVNIFKTKRHKGWWPFRGRDIVKNKEILAGKVEVEIQVLTEDEYKQAPAGLGRSDPQALPAPKRPDISFSWFKNPLKALKFLLCHRFRAQIIVFFIMGILVFMGMVAIYAFPNYIVKRIIGA